MSAPLDPILLAAYADDQLSPEEAARVERHLAKSPEDRQTVEALREMNARLASAFEAPRRDPLPPGLRERLAGAGRTPGRRTWWPVAAGSALAASVGLAAGYLGGVWTAEHSGLIGGDLARSSAFHALLESRRDGDAANLGHGTATLGTTFLDGRGEPCRDFEWSGDPGASSTWAIACRRGEEWLVEIAVSRPTAGADNRDAYVPAAGASEKLIGAALEAIDAGPVLGPDEVDLLISSNWNPQ